MVKVVDIENTRYYEMSVIQLVIYKFMIRLEITFQSTKTYYIVNAIK